MSNVASRLNRAERTIGPGGATTRMLRGLTDAELLEQYDVICCGIEHGEAEVERRWPRSSHEALYRRLATPWTDGDEAFMLRKDPHFAQTCEEEVRALEARR